MRNIIDVNVLQNVIELVSNICDDGNNESCINFRVDRSITVELVTDSDRYSSVMTPVDGNICYELSETLLRTAGRFVVNVGGVTPLEFVIETNIAETSDFLIRLSNGVFYVFCTDSGRDSEESGSLNIGKEYAGQLLFVNEDGKAAPLRVGSGLSTVDGALVVTIENYTGAYEVTPSASESVTLETAQKCMARDVTVQKIPYYDVDNVTGGSTVYIASEV